MSSSTHQLTYFQERTESCQSPSSCRQTRPRWRASACPGPGGASCEGSPGSGRPAVRGGSEAAEAGGAHSHQPAEAAPGGAHPSLRYRAHVTHHDRPPDNDIISQAGSRAHSSSHSTLLPKASIRTANSPANRLTLENGIFRYCFKQDYSLKFHQASSAALPHC